MLIAFFGSVAAVLSLAIALLALIFIALKRYWLPRKVMEVAVCLHWLLSMAGWPV